MLITYCIKNIVKTFDYFCFLHGRYGPVLEYFADINFRGSGTPELFAGQTFADLTKIREIRESFCPRKFVRLK